MKIILWRTGGIIAMVKKAEKEVTLSASELHELNSCLQPPAQNEQMRDNNEYRVTINEKSFSIDWKKIPDKFKPIFNDLKDNLQIVKHR